MSEHHTNDRGTLPPYFERFAALVESGRLADITKVYELRALFVLVRHMDGETGDAFPQYEKIADATGISLDHLSRTMRGLIEKGLIEKVGTRRWRVIHQNEGNARAGVASDNRQTKGNAPTGVSSDKRRERGNAPTGERQRPVGLKATPPQVPHNRHEQPQKNHKDGFASANPRDHAWPPSKFTSEERDRLAATLIDLGVSDEYAAALAAFVLGHYSQSATNRFLFSLEWALSADKKITSPGKFINWAFRHPEKAARRLKKYLDGFDPVAAFDGGDPAAAADDDDEAEDDEVPATRSDLKRSGRRRARLTTGAIDEDEEDDDDEEEEEQDVYTDPAEYDGPGITKKRR